MNTTTQHVLRTGKTITFLNVQDVPYKRGGRTFERAPEAGHNVSVTRGESIRLFGLDRNRVNGPVSYDRTFKIGDTCVESSYNLTYLGTIVAIGAKTVSVKEDNSSRVKRMTFASFAWRNRHFDLEKICKRNSEWMD